MSRRLAGAFGAVVLVAAALTLGATPAGAAGTLTPWSSSVAVGATFSVTASGCPVLEEDTDDGFTYQRPQLSLITGSGAGERMAAEGESVTYNGTRYRFRVPGWVDPADAAVVAGRCVRTTYSYDEFDGETTTNTTLFTYPDAAIDITAGTAVPAGPFVSLDRTTAAGGQVITLTMTGCEGAAWVEAALAPGSDLSFRTIDEFVVGDGVEAEAGATSLPLALNTRGEFTGMGEMVGGGPLPEGDYVLFSACGFESEDEFGYLWAEPQLVTVSGTNPSDSWTITADDEVIEAMGSGCTAGTTVTVHFRGYAYTEEWLAQKAAAHRGLVSADLRGLARLTPDQDGEIDESVTTVAGGDGTWMVTTPVPEDGFDLDAYADCGDPAATGFRYVQRYLSGSTFADLYLDRVSPTSAPTGDLVALSVNGFCDEEVTAVIADRDRTVLSESDPFLLNDYGMGTGTVTAPDRAGQYLVYATCGTDISYPDLYEVFAPEQVSATAPLAGEPAEGWPTQGARQTYNGKIGPIDLPAMDMGEEMAGTRALGPNGFFISVPRPDGDFAITEISFDLVDAEGMPVGQDMAHLHHFVIANRSGTNPACPGGTFGLPGQIVAASGAERTVLSMGDPYGLVVKDTDDWTGVYELMSRAMEDQTVFLTYDITYRTDIANVRPITPYFGSASGCDSFTWTVDGSGTPDTQSTFVKINEAGRLIGTGAHIHNGAMHADMTNDRGRRLCRSEIDYGDEPVGHDMLGSGPSRREPARADTSMPATTIVDPVDPMDPGWPPEFYDDDLGIDGISTCPLAESVSAGERLRFDAVYENDRPRSGVMGIYTFYVWEGGGPAQPGPAAAEPIPGNPNYSG